MVLDDRVVYGGFCLNCLYGGTAKRSSTMCCGADLGCEERRRTLEGADLDFAHDRLLVVHPTWFEA